MRGAAVALAAAAALVAPAAAHAAGAAAPTSKRAWIAQLVARTPAWPQPRPAGTPRMLDPLGRWTGGPVGLLVLRMRGEWVKVRLPDRPNRAAGWISVDRVVLRPTRWRVVINVASLLDPLGSAASHGCIRVDSGEAAWLAREVRRPACP